MLCATRFGIPPTSPPLSSHPPPPHPPSPVLIYGGHKYLCRYVTHIRWQYFRLFPVLHSQLSHCQLSASHGTTAPCLHTYTQSNLNHCHCTTHTHTHARHTRTHTFLTKGKLCICQGHRSNKGEARSSAARSDELCHLHVSTPLLTYTRTQTRAIFLSHIRRLVAQQCKRLSSPD